MIFLTYVESLKMIYTLPEKKNKNMQNTKNWFNCREVFLYKKRRAAAAGDALLQDDIIISRHAKVVGE